MARIELPFSAFDTAVHFAPFNPADPSAPSSKFVKPEVKSGTPPYLELQFVSPSSKRYNLYTGTPMTFPYGVTRSLFAKPGFDLNPWNAPMQFPEDGEVHKALDNLKDWVIGAIVNGGKEGKFPELRMYATAPKEFLAADRGLSLYKKDDTSGTLSKHFEIRAISKPGKPTWYKTSFFRPDGSAIPLEELAGKPFLGVPMISPFRLFFGQTKSIQVDLEKVCVLGPVEKPTSFPGYMAAIAAAATSAAIAPFPAEEPMMQSSSFVPAADGAGASAPPPSWITDAMVVAANDNGTVDATTAVDGGAPPPLPPPASAGPAPTRRAVRAAA